MNPSGSEFTLRVAICDLVERLKRMQHKCSYLEECRNQLVKEVIRLRLQNEWLAKQINDSPGASSLPQNLQCFCNQPSLVNSPYHTQQCHLNGQDIVCANETSDGLNKDESLHLMNILNQFEQEDVDNKQDSIKNLTIQMLKDLEAEMKTGRLKADLINFVKNSAIQNDNNELFKEDLMIKFDESESIDNRARALTKLSSNSSANYEAFNNNSDYYSNSHNLNIPFEDLYPQNINNANYKESDFLSNKVQSDISLTSLKESSQADQLINCDEQQQIRDRAPENATRITSLFKEKDSRGERKAKVMLKQINGKGDSQNGLMADKLNTNLPLMLANIDMNLKDEDLINIIVTVRDDLKGLCQGILTSTEKLNKIKSRQLRYYFQKQINLENSAKAKQSQPGNHLFGSFDGSNSGFK